MRANGSMNLGDDGRGKDLRSDSGCIWNRDADGYERKMFFFFLQTIQNDDVSIHIDGEAI